MAADPLVAAGESEAVGGGGAHGDRCADRGRERGLGLGPARADPRALPITWTATLPIVEAGRAHPAGRLGEQGGAGGAGPRGVGGAEVRAEVAEPGGREQRVAGSVRGDVGV